MDYEIIKMDDQTWRIENNGVRFFLLIGESKGLLIDSGMTTKNAKEIAMSITHLPIELINTHTDRDHIAGNNGFDEVYMHPSEYVNYVSHQLACKPKAVFEGDIIDLGNRKIHIIHLPGHTPGSIALLDTSRKILFGGDSIQDGRIYMFGPMRNMYAYIDGLEHLQNYINDFNLIYPSHGTIPIQTSMINSLIKGAIRVINKEIEPVETVVHGKRIHEYKIDVASFLCE